MKKLSQLLNYNAVVRNILAKSNSNKRKSARFKTYEKSQTKLFFPVALW